MPFETFIRDVMHPIERYDHLNESAPLKQAMQLMQRSLKQKQLAHLVIVGKSANEDDVIKGVVSPADMVFGMARPFLRGAEKTGPIFWEGQLESECRLALQKPVETVMRPIQVCIGDDEMLMEAIFLLNKYKVDFMPVIRSDEVCGLIHLDDILKVMTRIDTPRDNKN